MILIDAIKQHPLYDKYFISKYGRVYTKNHKGVLVERKPYKEKTGYMSILLFQKGKRIFRRIHQLVADTFLPKHHKEGYDIIHHINSVRYDNNVSNLQRVKDIATHNQLHKQLRMEGVV